MAMIAAGPESGPFEPAIDEVRLTAGDG